MFIWIAVTFKVKVQSKSTTWNDGQFPNWQLFIWPTGNHDWGQDKSTGARRCPMCLELGPVVTLCMGIEPAFYVDSGPPSFAFNPCGHMASEASVKWVSFFFVLSVNGGW